MISDGSRGGAWGPGPPFLFWVKKEEMTEGKIADTGQVNQDPPPPPPLSSRSGSATDDVQSI